jgi:hypothetical protein
MAMKTAALLTAPHGENQITETGNQGVRNQNWDGETTELVKKNQNIQQLNQGTRTTQQDTFHWNPNKFTSETQRSPPSLPHLIIEMKI